MKCRRITVILHVILSSILFSGSSPSAAQTSYFSTSPDWISGFAPATEAVFVGDYDGDGDLDLLCAISTGETVLYRNDNYVLDIAPIWSYNTDNIYYDALLGDIDQDGDLDILICNSGGNNAVFENRDGDFTCCLGMTSRQYNTVCAAMGDLDNDGDLDFVFGNDNYINDAYDNVNGSMRATPLWSSQQAERTKSIALGDIDNDGDLDLVCGNGLNRRNTIYLNSGYHTGARFPSTPDWSSATAYSTESVVLGDIDGDGDLDLVCGNYNQNNTLFFNGAGAMSVLPIILSADTNSTRGIDLGDVDGDGDLDLVCGNFNQPNALYLNMGGMFNPSPAWESQAANATTDIAFADVNGDGSLDIVCGNFNQPNTVYFNTRAYLEGTGESVGDDHFYSDIALGDVDDDGDLDLVASCPGSRLRLYRNEDGHLVSSTGWYSDLNYHSFGVTLGDVDNDGDLDLVSANQNQPNTLFLNEDGTFSQLPVWSSDSSNWTLDVALGDIDRDGDLDLVCANGQSGTTLQPNTLYLNHGGIFSAAPDWNGLARNTAAIALGDLDLDGDLDLACANCYDDNSIYFNENGNFSHSLDWRYGQSCSKGIALGDIDGDGDPDVVLGSDEAFAGGYVCELYFNDGGSISSNPDWISGEVQRALNITLGDVDGDGDLDLACGNFDQPEKIYLNNDGIFSSNPVWYSDSSFWTYCVEFGDIDRDGDLDLVTGNYWGEFIRVYNGTMNPPFGGNHAQPANHLPNNTASIQDLQIERIGDNTIQLSFDLFDVEGDPVWIVPQYAYEGVPEWHPMETGIPGTKLGPFTSSQEGSPGSITWNITQLPIDRRNVSIRLLAIQTPQRVDIIQHAPFYFAEAGQVIPIRPGITTSSNSISFPTVTVGDSVSHDLVIGNDGSADLVINSIGLPSQEMRITDLLPLVVQPGQRDTITIHLEPRTVLPTTGEMRINSNDPLNPVIWVSTAVDIRDIVFETELLTQTESIPLGQAVTLIVTPAPQVNIEQGTLYFRLGNNSGGFQDSITLTASKNGFVSIIPGDQVTEAGIEYYVKVENSGLFAVDPPGAPADSLYFQPVESPTALTAVPIPNVSAAFHEGLDISIQVFLQSGSQFQEGALYYRAGGERDYHSITISSSDTVMIATIPGSAAGPRGLEYWVGVQTLTASLTEPARDPAGNPHQISVTVPNLEEERIFAGEKYRLLSIPLEMEGTIAGSLTDDVGGPDNTRWRMFAYPANDGGYSEIPNDSLFAFQLGQAYWLITKDPHRIDTGPDQGISAATAEPFRIDLHPGYNLIGCPYSFPVAWDSCLVDTLAGDPLPMSVASARFVEPPVSWDPDGGYRFDAEFLEPFDGVWVKNLTGGTIGLMVPAREARPDTIAVARSNTSTYGNDEWYISLQVSCDAKMDCGKRIGYRKDASLKWDRHDRSEPPLAPGGGLSLYFPHDDWGDYSGAYAIDMRGNYTAICDDAIGDRANLQDLWGHLWFFDIEKTYSREKGGDEVVIEFDGLASLPADAAVHLVDRELDKPIDLRDERLYRFYQARRARVTDERETRFILLVGSESFIESRREYLSRLPARTALHQNYPNPFNPKTILRYDVAEPGQVRLRVYDARGALVRVLYDGHRDRGRYEAAWDGFTGSGEPAATGIYFCRLTTGVFTETRKMVLLK